MSENYKKIEFYAGNTIDTAVEKLLNYQEQGILAYGTFNGVVLYSDTVTLDDAYKSITGRTKAEHDQFIKNGIDQYNKEKADHEAKIPELTIEWIEKGKAILTEDKWDLWAEIVPIRLGDLYRGLELGCCLDIVKILNNNGSLEEAEAEINKQGHSGMSLSIICSMVSDLSVRGKDFVAFINPKS